MHSNGCFPLTFYFSLTFIKNIWLFGTHHVHVCGNHMEHERWSWNGPFRRVWKLPSGGACLFEDKNARLMSNCVLVFIMHMNSETRLLGACLLCGVFQIVSSQFPSNFLLMWLRRYLIILLTDTCWKVRRKKTKKNPTKNTICPTQRCFEWKVITNTGKDTVTIRLPVAN